MFLKPIGMLTNTSVTEKIHESQHIIIILLFSTVSRCSCTMPSLQIKTSAVHEWKWLGEVTDGWKRETVEEQDVEERQDSLAREEEQVRRSTRYRGPDLLEFLEWNSFSQVQYFYAVKNFRMLVLFKRVNSKKVYKKLFFD